MIGAQLAGLYGSGGAAPVATAFESIATVTVSSSQSSVTFTSIPGTYKHLQLRMIAKDDRALNRDTALLTFNSDTSTSYVAHSLYGDGSTAAAQYQAAAQAISLYRVTGNSGATNIFGATVLDILDYTNTNKNTVIRSLSGFDVNGSGEVWFNSGLWLNTAQVSSITLTPGNATNWLQYSSFALYGIKG